MIKSFLKIFVLANFFLLTGASVSAQSSADSNAVSAAGIPRGVQISPIRFEKDLKPGEVWFGSVNVKNFSEENKTLLVSAENFVVTPDTESVEFYPSEKAEHFNVPDIVDWVKIPQKTVTLAPGESKFVPFRVRVPFDAPTGGYYGALFFLISEDTVGVSGGTKLSVNSRMGVLLLMRVRGEEPVRIEGRLTNFGADKEVYFHSPVNFKTAIFNAGNLHFRGSGHITITAWNGKKKTVLPLESRVNYPDKTRTYLTRWEFGPWTLGKYTAALSYESMSGLVVLEATDTFWVISWLPLAVFSVVSLVLIILFTFLSRRYAIVRR